MAKGTPIPFQYIICIENILSTQNGINKQVVLVNAKLSPNALDLLFKIARFAIEVSRVIARVCIILEYRSRFWLLLGIFNGIFEGSDAWFLILYSFSNVCFDIGKCKFS